MRFTGFNLTMAEVFRSDDKKVILRRQQALSPLHATVCKAISR
jgi:hypothetical protein